MRQPYITFTCLQLLVPCSPPQPPSAPLRKWMFRQPGWGPDQGVRCASDASFELSIPFHCCDYRPLARWSVCCGHMRQCRSNPASRHAVRSAIRRMLAPTFECASSRARWTALPAAEATSPNLTSPTHHLAPLTFMPAATTVQTCRRLQPRYHSSQPASMMLAQRINAQRPSVARRAAAVPAGRGRCRIVTRAGMDTNLFVNILASGAAGAAATAVTLVTAGA